MNMLSIHSIIFWEKKNPDIKKTPSMTHSLQMITTQCFFTIRSSSSGSLGGAESSHPSDEVYVQEELTRELRTTLPPAIKASWNQRLPFTWVLVQQKIEGGSNQKNAKRMIEQFVICCSQVLGFVWIGCYVWWILKVHEIHYPSDTQPLASIKKKPCRDALRRWLSMWLTQSLRAKNKAREIINLKGFMFKLTLSILCVVCLCFYTTYIVDDALSRRLYVFAIDTFQHWYFNYFPSRWGSGGTAALTPRMVFEFHKSWQL